MMDQISNYSSKDLAMYMYTRFVGEGQEDRSITVRNGEYSIKLRQSCETSNTIPSIGIERTRGSVRSCNYDIIKFHLVPLFLRHFPDPSNERHYCDVTGSE